MSSLCAAIETPVHVTHELHDMEVDYDHEERVTCDHTMFLGVETVHTIVEVIHALKISILLLTYSTVMWFLIIQ